MSGNPFRRTKGARLPEYDDELGFGGDAVVAQRNTQPPSKRKKKKKVVTIQTPPHSPEEPTRRLSSGRLSPPPPPRLPENDVEDSDSTATADSDLEQALRNTRRNSGSLALPASSLSQGAPYNPFARTLATSEAAFGLQRTGEGGYEVPAMEYGEVGGKGVAQQGGRSAMDVDQFKNILLTGSAAPSPPSGPHATTPRASRLADSSSSTTTSSASTFEPYLDAQQETPRTSFDHMDSPSESSDGEDQESSGLMSGPERLDDFAPPAPPKHSTRGPQTVSFADFDETITQGASARSPLGNTANGMESLGPPTLHRSTSDLNKPLPLPPQAPLPMPPPSEPGTVPVPVPAAKAQSKSDETVDTKKALPPPPPTARRVGHASTASQTRDRSTSNPTPAADLSPQPQPKLDDLAPKPPPPPPTRKTKSSSQTPLPDPTPTAPTPSPAPSTSSTEPRVLPPPPPLRRMGSKAGTSVVRASSTSSRSSAQQRKENAPTSTSAPIPPPPPRRGGKRESVEVPRQAAVAEEEGEGGEQVGRAQGARVEMQSDILADMTAFQAEIDALRARAGAQG